MPRKSSRSKSPPKSAFRKVPPRGDLTQRTPLPPPPPHISPLPSSSSTVAQPPQTVTVEHKTGIWDSMKQGFGWGIGTSIARNMFGGAPTVSPIVPPASSSTVSVPIHTAQEIQNQPAYTQCRQEGGDHEACKQYLSE